MSNLLPEKRMDKNGHLVTRHVAIRSTSVTLRDIPVPKVTTPPKSNEKVARRVFDRYCKSDLVMSDYNRMKIREKLKWLKPKTLSMLDDLSKSKLPEDVETNKRVHTFLVTPQRKLMDVTLRNIMYHDAYERKYLLGLKYHGDTWSLFKKAEKSARRVVCGDTGILETPDQVAQLQAVMKGIVATSSYTGKNATDVFMNQNDSIRNCWGVDYLRIQDTMKLLMERPEEGDAIAAMIEERGPYNAEGFRDALDVITPMREGFL